MKTKSYLTVGKTSKLYKRALGGVIDEAVGRGLYGSSKQKAFDHLSTWNPYEIVCDWMGFDAGVHFVSINRGRIGFTCGKPDEVRSLQKACRRLAVPMSKSLETFCA